MISNVDLEIFFSLVLKWNMDQNIIPADSILIKELFFLFSWTRASSEEVV